MVIVCTYFHGILQKTVKVITMIKHLLNPKKAGSFDPISQPGGGGGGWIPPPFGCNLAHTYTKSRRIISRNFHTENQSGFQIMQIYVNFMHIVTGQDPLSKNYDRNLPNTYSFYWLYLSCFWISPSLSKLFSLLSFSLSLFPSPLPYLYTPGFLCLSVLSGLLRFTLEKS